MARLAVWIIALLVILYASFIAVCLLASPFFLIREKIQAWQQRKEAPFPRGVLPLSKPYRRRSL